jgi:Ca2+-binding RTX toxin-like protein
VPRTRGERDSPCLTRLEPALVGELRVVELSKPGIHHRPGSCSARKVVRTVGHPLTLRRRRAERRAAENPGGSQRCERVPAVHTIPGGHIHGPDRPTEEEDHVQYLTRLAATSAAFVGLTALVVAQSHAAPGVKQPKLKDGALTVQGTAGSDKITLRLQAGDPAILQVDFNDGDAVFSFARANVTSIDVNAGAGDDVAGVDEGNGAFTDTIPTTIDGGSGDDNIIGGSGEETIKGGAGNDSVDAGRGNDTVVLGSGDDSFVWNPGEGSDTVDGRSGNDTMLFNGANIAEQIDLSANGNRLKLFRNIANITMDTSGIEQVDLNALGGADTITVNDVTSTALEALNLDLGANDGQIDRVIVAGTNHGDRITVAGADGAASVAGLATTVNVAHAEAAGDTLTVNAFGGPDTVDASTLTATSFNQFVTDGGDGNDTIAGSQGADVIFGGPGNDSVDGNQASDVATLGDGNDTFVWDPGDGSDIVEGQGGTDTMVFNGANIAENIDLSANGSRLRLFRNVGNITMDTGGVEHVAINAVGGADTVVANDLTGTGVTAATVDLGSNGAGDGSADQVVVSGTSGPDAITVAGSDGSATVSGLAASVSIANTEPANDTLTVNSLAGTDTVDASSLDASSVKLQLNGGDDADQLIGSAGNDLVNGGRGNDVAQLGSGDDSFVWNPGDGSDTAEGQAGTDTMVFNGANIAEQIDLSANGGRLRLFRNVASITMDTGGVEQVNLNALGGVDGITVNDLTGTDVKTVNVDLGSNGAGDGSADTVVVNGTNVADAINVSGSNGSATVSGTAATVNIANAEPANDGLTVNALDGDDAVGAATLANSVLALTVNGGAGADVIVGSAGNDTLLGGPGDDVLSGGPGQDVLDGGPGNNVLIQD